MELFEGRPENAAGRLSREIRTYDFLDDLGIEYKRTDHEPANNMEACNEIDAVLEVRHYSKETEQFDDITCVTLFYREEEKEEMTKI